MTVEEKKKKKMESQQGNKNLAELKLEKTLGNWKQNYKEHDGKVDIYTLGKQKQR